MVILGGKVRTYALDVIFPILRGPVRIIPDHLRPTLDLTIGTFWTAPDIAHLSLLARADSAIVIE